MIAEAVYKNEHCYRHLSSFLDEIPQDLLAVASFKCGAFTRALMHYELHIGNTRPLNQQHVDFFQVL